MGKAEEDYNRVSGLAADLRLEGEDLLGFVSDSMKRLGHRARTVWEDATPEGGGDGGGGDFFTRNRQNNGGSGGGDGGRGGGDRTRRVGGSGGYED